MERRISRREFGKRLATGAALLGLQPSCTSLSPSLPAGQLLRNDLKDLSGTLLFDDTARQATADDFGHIVRRLPLAVLTIPWRLYQMVVEGLVVSVAVEMVFVVFMVESFHRLSPVSPLLNVPAGLIAAESLSSTIAALDADSRLALRL